jgi:hypothetical protein
VELGPKRSMRAHRQVSRYSSFAGASLDRIAGSNVIVAGTAIFGSEHPEHVIATLKGAVNTALATVID